MSSNTGKTTQNNLLIGLTGGIGSGKSTVASLFEQLGVRIIDTDAISRGLSQANGEAVPAIRDTFGAAFIDETHALDRGKMRKLVFTNPTAKKQLEDILHPLILKQARQLAATVTSAPYTLVVIPLLFEVQDYRGWLQRTLLVDCPEEIQVSRTMQRSGLDKPLAQSIIAQQIARSQRVALADDIIRNDSDLPSLSAQIGLLHSRFLSITTGSD
jgi:dephospho-CoA kinase